MFDFVIIGGGIAGASVAYELAAYSSVLLIEREAHCGYHTTGRSAALFSENYGNATIRALTRASRSTYETPPENFTQNALLTPRDVMFIARKDQMASVAAMTDILGRGGKKSYLLTAGDVCSRVSIIRQDYVACALLDESSMDIDVHALHQGYLRGARSRGAQIATSEEVLNLARSSAGWEITTQKTTFQCAAVINAAGAWADSLATAAGASTIGLTPLRRTAMILDAPTDVDVSSWPLVLDIDEKFYFKPEAGKLLASPADETPSAPCDAQAEEMDLAIAIDRIQQAADLPVRTITRHWAGLRTFAADRSPVVGYDPHLPGFFWLAGQGGYGIQSAPALAKVAAALACGKAVPSAILDEGFDVGAVSPARVQLTSFVSDKTDI